MADVDEDAVRVDWLKPRAPPYGLVEEDRVLGQRAVRKLCLVLPDPAPVHEGPTMHIPYEQTAVQVRSAAPEAPRR